jgi:hypothetical protein
VKINIDRKRLSYNEKDRLKIGGGGGVVVVVIPRDLKKG